MSTARVSLRDAYLEVTADIDLLLLLERLRAGAQANASPLADLDEPELRDLLKHAEQVLQTQTRLEADGQRIGVEVHLSLDSQKIRDLLQASPEARHAHAPLVPVRWEGTEPLSSAKQIEVVFPAALGPVLITFVQPSTRLTAPGARAAFSVLEKPGSASSEAPIRKGWAEGAVLLGVVAILLNIGISRRRRGIETPPSSVSRPSSFTGR